MPHSTHKAALMGQAAMSVASVSALIVATTLNSVLFKMSLLTMTNYEFIMTVSTTLGYMLVLWPWTFVRWLFFTCMGFMWDESWLPANRRMQLPLAHALRTFPRNPWYTYPTMALLDALSVWLAVYGGNSTTGATQVLLGNCNIIVMMVIAIVLTRVRIMRATFGWTHVVGACLILFSIICVVAPEMGGNGREENTKWGIFLFSMSVIPASISGIYKEIAMKRLNLGVLEMNSAVATWQLLFAWMFLPLHMTRFGGSMTLRDITSMLSDGTACLLSGVNSRPGDACKYALETAVPALFANIASNNLMNWISKHGSATFSVIASTISLPLASILFSWNFLMGSHAHNLIGLDYLALFFAICGFFVYRLRQDHDTLDDPQVNIMSVSDLPTQQLRILLGGALQPLKSAQGDAMSVATSRTASRSASRSTSPVRDANIVEPPPRIKERLD